jgi:hypothetical protein
MKKNYLWKTLVIGFLFIFGSIQSQTTTIDFETVDAGYTASATEGSGFTDVFNRYDGSTHSGGAIGSNSSFVWAVEDLTLSNPSIDLDQIDVTGSASFTFSIDMLAHHFEDWDSTDELLITYSIDGGMYQNLMWVQMHTGSGDASNGPAALDTNFDGDGECGAGTTLPALTTGTQHGCTVSSSSFETFTTGSIALSSNSTLDIRLQFNNLTSTDEGIYIDNIVITETPASSNPTVSFDTASSSENETDMDVVTSGIPITMTNYDAANVTITPTVNGASTAEAGDYTIDLTPLVFDANETLNIPLTIRDDADFDNETIIIDFTVTSGTADLGTSQHTVTITDDDIPQIIITEIMYNTPSTDDEWIELYNNNGASIDISNWTIEYNSGTIFTFPGSTTITDGDYITIALGSNGDGTYNNDNPFTPDFSSVADPIASTSDTNTLGNTSGTITVKNSGGITIDEVAYDDGDASSTDGSGPSYEIIDVTLDNSATNSNWQASAFNGGSPDKVNTTTWSGATDNDWNTSSNWSAGVPVSASDILIPASLTNYPTASGAVTVNSATMNSGSSLIAQSTFTGTITYNRNLGTSNWYLAGIPVAGETIEDMIANNSFATGTGSNIGWAPYDNSQAAAADRWDYQTAASTGSLTSGGGYSVKLASAGDLAFTGTMETADVGVSITDGTGSSGNAFNLVGNPYPSYLAANTNADGTNNLLSINTASLTEETLWLWNQGTSSYDVFNQASSAFYIAPGQGFFVSSTGSNTFNFTEAMQSHQGTDSFQRTTNSRPEINLVMTNGADTKDAKIFYIDGTTTGFDNGFDSSVFSGVGNSFAIYTHAVADGNGRNLGIQSLPDNNFENMIIPVGINATSGTDITISAGVSNLPEGINVYLEDKNDGSFTLLDSSSDFITTLNVDLNGIGRFYLHTSSEALSTDEVNLNNISIYTSESNLRIVGVQNGTAKVSIYNILGKEVLRTLFEGNGLNDVALPSLRTGVYIVQLATETGTLNKKVIIE